MMASSFSSNEPKKLRKEKLTPPPDSNISPKWDQGADGIVVPNSATFDTQLSSEQVPDSTLPASSKMTDVVIVGAGPVGLLIAYQLSRFGCHNYIIIDREDKTHGPVYGRACTLWPRTTELWDQLDLMDDMFAAGGVMAPTGYNFKDGKLASGGLSFGHRLDKFGETAFRFSFNLRQRIMETILEQKLDKEHDSRVYTSHQLESMTDTSLVEGVGGEEPKYPVTLQIRNLKSKRLLTVRTKYVIGADGGKSTVRKLSGIPFEGNRTGAKWVRMDAEIETDMPNARSLNSVQSPTHGLILFCPIDANLTRIGYIFSDKLQQKWGLGESVATMGPRGENGGTGTLKEEALIIEAQEACKPFKLDFKRVDWFTIYGIGQCIAADFIKGRTFLAGDSCHTHSSGSAQGLNTGSHDAINLGWKLGLVLKNLASPRLLATYHDERRAVLQQVIDNDVTITTLMHGGYPPKYQGRQESSKDLLSEWCDNAENKAFTLGLGVAYCQENLINVPTQGWTLSTIRPGERGPDAEIVRPISGERIRLYSILPNKGMFRILVFAGCPHKPQAYQNYKAFRMAMDGGQAWTLAFPKTNNSSVGKTYEFTTLIAGEDIGVVEILRGCAPLGRAYYDPLRKCHENYGIDSLTGGVVVLRPDGHVGTICHLGPTTNEVLASYFARFMVQRRPRS